MEKPFIMQNGVRFYDFKKTFVYLNAYGKYKLGESFNLKDEDASIIYKLLIYTIRDKESCDKHGIDLNKGILLTGPVGCGKTSLMTLLKHFAYIETNYTMKSTRDISAEFNIDGYPTIFKYGKTHKIYCFDDLGVEQNMKHFGNECNTIAEILLHRYDLLESQNIVTHATTNLNANELEKLYGNRVRSRLRSMFNLISFPATSMDKRK
ncbi:MAG: hypothetical protein RIQ59_1834 [Bacteroidota bacterium]|jgi:DNA replication protein DnaC